MPIDPSILLSSRPPQGLSTTDFVSAIGQIQQVREQTEARRLAAEERRAAAQEAAAIRQRERQVQDTLREAVAFDPATGEPTVDWKKITGHLDPAVSFKVLDTINESKKNALQLRSTQMDFGTKSKLYLGTVAAPPVKEGNYDKKLWDLAATTAYNEGALSREQWTAALATTDQAEIQRATDAAIQTAAQLAGTKNLEKVTKYDPATGQTVETFVTPTEGAEFVQPPKTSPLSYQSENVLLDGRPALASFNPQTGAYTVAGQDVTARVRPIPPQGPGPEPLVPIVGPDGRPVLVPRSQAVGKTPASAAGDGGGVKLTGAQQEDLATMMTVQELAAEAETLGTKTNWTGVGPVEGRIGGTFVGYGGAEGETLRNLVGNIQGTIAKLRGGTAFSAAEKAMLETYTPTTTDTAPKIRAKLKSLASFIEKKRQNTLRVAAGQYTVPAAGATGAKPTADPLGIR